MKKSIALIASLAIALSVVATCTYKETKGSYDVSYSAASESEDSTGRITGRVLDINTGKPIPANLHIIDTNRGTYSNFEGVYWIIDIPPGVYRLRAKMRQEYNAIIAENVRIAPGKITIVNFKLKRIPKPSPP